MSCEDDGNEQTGPLFWSVLAQLRSVCGALWFITALLWSVCSPLWYIVASLWSIVVVSHTLIIIGQPPGHCWNVGISSLHHLVPESTVLHTECLAAHSLIKSLLVVLLNCVQPLLSRMAARSSPVLWRLFNAGIECSLVVLYWIRAGSLTKQSQTIFWKIKWILCMCNVLVRWWWLVEKVLGYILSLKWSTCHLPASFPYKVWYIKNFILLFHFLLFITLWWEL